MVKKETLELISLVAIFGGVMTLTSYNKKEDKVNNAVVGAGILILGFGLAMYAGKK